MDKMQIIDLLKEQVRRAGSQNNWAVQHGLSGAYVNDVLHGRRDPADRLLDALGYEKYVVYRRVKK